VVQCSERYINNPKNEYKMLDARVLQKARKNTQSYTSSVSTSSGSSTSSFKGSASSSSHDAVQISPQQVSLKLRISKLFSELLNLFNLCIST